MNNGNTLSRIQPTGAELISAERTRQILQEGFTPEHDNEYNQGELIDAVISYVEFDPAHNDPTVPPPLWPWHPNDWKPKDRRANLVRAGALIAAEIDRLNREYMHHQP